MTGWRNEPILTPMNPRLAFVTLAKEVSTIRERADQEETLSGILAAQLSRQRGEMAALEADIQEAIRTLDKSERQQDP
jgi:hypothetical protein